MAENSKIDTKSASIEEQTSIGSYLLKQLYQQTVAWGGMLGGAYLGLLAAKPGSKAAVSIDPAHQAQWEKIPVVSKLPGLKNVLSKNRLMWGGGLGALAGSLVAGVVLGYEHWKKIKQSQLQVDEITKDVSDIEIFKKADPELKAENARLWAELHKRDKPQDSHVGKVTAQADAAAEQVSR